jgi:predicted dehydrogenase
MSLNIAVVGGGFMGQLHARTVVESEVASLGAVVELNDELGRSVASSLGTRHLHSIEEALVDTAIDGYIVALPDRLHVDTSCLILRAGKPVLLEKPMAHTLEAASEIARAASEGGGRLLIGQILRYDPRYVAAAKAVSDGAIGEPLHSSAGRISSRAVGTRMNGTSSVLFYLGVHDADAIQWVTGRSIWRVYSRSISKLMPALGVDSEDAILSVVEFDDGSVGQLFNGWTRTEDDPVGIDGRLEVFGTRGHIEVDVRDSGLRIYGHDGLRLPDGSFWPEVNDRIRGNLAAEIAHFARSLLSGSPFIVSVEEAMRAVAVNDAILRSVESGQPEQVAPIAL